MQRTLVLLKPDCVQRRLIGRVLARFEDKGLHILAMKLIQINSDLAKKHYAEHLDKPFYPSLEKYITSCPVVAAVIAGPQAISLVRKMVGPTNGIEAPAGTIRGDFSTSGQKNLVHASDGPEAAAREIGLFFDEAEILEYANPCAEWLQ